MKALQLTRPFQQQKLLLPPQLFQYLSCMTTTDHVQYWLDAAGRDWDTVEALQTVNPRATLVFAHWTLEKLSKALCVREHSGAIAPASDDVAELLAAAFIALTPTQVELVGRVKAFHDDVVESDPERPVAKLKEHETPLTLITQVNTLRQHLLAILSKETV